MADPQPSARELHQELQLFAKAGDLPNVRLILERLGEEEGHRILNLPDEITGELPFHCAARGGHVEVLKAVLPEDVNAKSTKGGMSVLHFAAAHGHSKAVQWLFDDTRTDLNLEDERGNTPLHLAVLLGRKDVAKFLVNAGASLSALNNDKMMPVSYCQDQDMFQALLSSGLHVRRVVTSQIDAARRTILHYAAQYNATDWGVIAKLISGMEADQLGLLDSQGDSFLHIAAKAGNMNVLEALKKLGIDTRSLISGPDASSLIGGPIQFYSPGLYALLHNHRKFFDELVGMGEVKITLGCIIEKLRGELENNSEIQERLALFESTLPTYLALYANKGLLFEFLLKTTGLTVNQWDDKHKKTCLHWAVVDKRKDIVVKLCKNAQLRPSIEDADGKTALQHAFEQNNHEVMEILRGRPNFKDHEEKLNRDREVYVQALNSILVGAALIASVTFAGWLQLPGGTASDAVFKTLGLKVFWASNNLSFYSAVATMCVTISALIPTPTRYVGDIVNQLRLAIVLDASLLALSLATVMVAFAAAGFAALRPSHVFEYEVNMRGTTAAGAILCTVMWLGFVLQLYRSAPSLKAVLVTVLHFVPAPWSATPQWDSFEHVQNLLNDVGGTSRFGYPNMSRDEIDNTMAKNLVDQYLASKHASVDTLPKPIVTCLSSMKEHLSKLGISET